MRTIDGQLFNSVSFFGRLRRDIKLLLRLSQMIFSYLIQGRRIRRAYRLKEAQGEIYWLDEDRQL